VSIYIIAFFLRMFYVIIGWKRDELNAYRLVVLGTSTRGRHAARKGESVPLCFLPSIANWRGNLSNLLIVTSTRSQLFLRQLESTLFFYTSLDWKHGMFRFAETWFRHTDSPNSRIQKPTLPGKTNDSEIQPMQIKLAVHNYCARLTWFCAYRLYQN